MRLFTFLLLMLFVNTTKAQTYYPAGLMGGQRLTFAPLAILNDTNALKQKWSLNKYAVLSTGFSVMRGGSASFIAAPMGLQLNRRLNNNLFAFAGVSIAPSYVNLNQSFRGFDLYKTGTPNGRLMNNGLGIYSRAEAGLMYVNDDRTFSISGSIGIERSTYPGFYVPARPLTNNPAGFNGTR